MTRTKKYLTTSETKGKSYCINGASHKDGQTRYLDNSLLTGGYCPECIQDIKKQVNIEPLDPEEKIRDLISQINRDYEVSVEAAVTSFWKRNRRYLIEIDDLGGYQILKDENDEQLYPDQKAFFKAEFPKLCTDSVARQRSIARIERQLELPIGEYPVRTLEPLRQFEIRDNKGNEKPKEIEKLVKAWTIACEIANNDRPNKEQILKAIQKTNGKIGGKRALTCLQKKERKEQKADLKQKYEAAIAQNEQLRHELEIAHETNYSLQVQLEEKCKEIQKLKCQLELVPIAIAC